MKQYLVKAVTTGFFTGNLSESKLQNFLNQHGAMGWKFVKSIHETRKVLGIFSREAHFVIFERDDSPPPAFDSTTTDLLLAQIMERIDNAPTPHLLRQLLRANEIEPEA